MQKEWLNQLKQAGLIKDDVFVFNASDVPTWLGNSVYKTPERLLYEKVNNIKKEVTPKMKMGVQLEDYIISQVSKMCNINLIQKDDWQKYNIKIIDSIGDIPVAIGGKVDAIGERMNILKDESIQFDYYLLEVKYMPTYQASEIKNTIPVWYLDQVLSYIFIYQKHALFGALCADGWVVKEIRIDDSNTTQSILDMNDKLMTIADAILKNQISKLNVKNKESIQKKVIKKIENKDTNLDYLLDKLIEAQKTHKRIIEQYKIVEKQIEDIKQEIKKRVPNEDIVYDYGNYKIKIDKRYFTKIDKDNLLEQYPEIYQMFVQEIPYKVITVEENS
jgi:predicted phage-related endonuclease